FTEALASGQVQVRVGLHTGSPLLTEEGYVGDDVHRAARIAACGHGGQVLVSASTAPLVEHELTDLGEHRLKDLSAPERVYQLGDGDFPALKSLYRTNLPVPATPFLGREAELGEVLSRIEAGARLVTLSGPGGTGKTRLALEAALTLVPEYKAGVFWVGLASLRDPALVSETVAQTLGAKDSLAAHIGERELLLLLDNLEQVIEAAPELGSLLEACPNLTLLCTSRELLRISGEVEYAVPPLATAEAVELFCARSQLEASEEIAELCMRLDSLPLAVELAAARTKALTPAQILERLSQRLDLLKAGRDADPRQQTLRATIEWSYELLSSEEQQLFSRLSVFAGGCTLEAAEEVAGADLDTLQSLIEKSLLRFSDERYWMLETVREYASETLAESGTAEELRGRHAEWFLALAEEADPRLWEGMPGQWLDRLDTEHDNIRAALGRLEVSGETQQVLRLAGLLWRFWNLRGHLAEGNRRLESALAADDRATPARARALNGAAAMAVRRGGTSIARKRAEEALALHRALGDELGAALSRSYLATAAAEERDWARARQIQEECVRTYRRLGDEDDAMLATWFVAWMCRELGDYDRARELSEENLLRGRAAGNERVQGLSLDALAMLAIDEGRPHEALALLEKAYSVNGNFGGSLEVALDLCRFARALVADGRLETAARLLAKGEALCAEIGASPESWPVLEAKLEETLSSVRPQLDDATFTEAWEQGRALTPDEAVALALASID
ncbi:MAG TPA: hypothetical protein VLA22_03080, partial [Gaiellaceae bacterium]|nr:hypothetical protein [Gaiellaceae bacterium]